MNSQQKLHMLEGLLRTAFEGEAIGTYGIRDSFFGDRYGCPGCWATRKIQGHATPTSSLGEVEHNEGCVLAQIHKMVMGSEEGVVFHVPSRETFGGTDPGGEFILTQGLVENLREEPVKVHRIKRIRETLGCSLSVGKWIAEHLDDTEVMS